MSSIDTLILITSVLLLLGIASSKISARLGIPVLVLFLVLGMLAGSEGPGGIAFDDYGLAYAIGTVALAFILFDGGLNTTFGAIRAVWRPALALATVGVLITAGIAGWAATVILDLSLAQGMLLGSIVASTDAAAVFAVLRSGGVGLSKRIAALLEVESGSNDPMAIFLTIGCIELLVGQASSAGALAWLFFSQMVLGTVFGIALGFASLWVVNHIQLKSAGLYPVLVMTLGLAVFGVTALFGGSGFLAVYLAGIVMGNRRMTYSGGAKNFLHAIAWLSQIVMFVFLGLLSFPSELLQVTGPALAIGAVLILVARPVAVFACMLPFKYRLNELFFVSCVGLKGAVPIVLATFPFMAGLPREREYFDVVFFIVVLSAAMQGSALPFLASLFGVRRPLEPVPPVKLEFNALQDVEGEVLDYLIRDKSRAAGREVKDLGLPAGVVIAVIARGDRVVPPNGKTRIEVGDHLILILAAAAHARIEEVLGEGLPAIEPVEDESAGPTGDDSALVDATASGSEDPPGERRDGD